MGSLAAPKIFVRRCRQHVHTSTLPFWISSISGGSRRGVVGSTTTRHFHEKDNYLSYDAFDDSSSSTVDDDPPSSFSSLRIPTHAAHKVCTPSDAVSLISRGDTIAVSGFVAQGSPDLILKSLADRYEQECKDGIKDGVGNLTILFGGGPGDWESRGLNYLASIPQLEDGSTAPPMIKRAIGAHFGQVPMLGELVMKNLIEAWTLPLGSISRMIRAQATHSPGHITTIGLGTYVDPTPGVGSGGAANDLARKSPLHEKLVTKLTIGYGEEMKTDYLLYKALPIQVGIIRATTADSSGNLSFEHESLRCDQLSVAMAARNSGGVVIAQVKRLSQVGSLPSRSVLVPGSMVDCVVVVGDDDQNNYHPMSYTTFHSPVLAGEIRSPIEDSSRLPLSERKVIARRAARLLKPGLTVNLGIGLPEGVASVAGEEGMLPYITLTTEPGSFGGMPASGKNFGPSSNADALIEMNQQFDFYDGGGLDVAFLGAAEISPSGDVNVSRMGPSRITGPGGFIDITQATRKVCFMCPFTAKGLEITFDEEKGSMSIVKEGSVKKFVNKVYETTFSGDECVRRGQHALYVTERCVFRRTAAHDTLELIEIAPGVDLEKDILQQMEFTPAISHDLKLMDHQYFRSRKMNLQFFRSLADRCTYHEDDHVLYIDLFGVCLTNEEEVDWIIMSFHEVVRPITYTKGPVDVVVSYTGFYLKSGLEDYFAEGVKDVEKRYYKSVKRFSGKAFRPSLLKKKVGVKAWDEKEIFKRFDDENTGSISPQQLRRGMKKMFGLTLKPHELKELCREKITPQNFPDVLAKCLSDFRME